MFPWKTTDLPTLVVIGIDCTGSCKIQLPYNYIYIRGLSVKFVDNLCNFVI